LTLDHPQKRAGRDREVEGWVAGAVATVVVGASFPVSAALGDFPAAYGQAARYLVGALILTAILRGRLKRPTAAELVLLAGVAAVGMAGFNLLLLAAVERIGGAITGVLVGLSPLLLALTRPTTRLLTSAAVVVAGAALVTGTDGGVTALGLAFAAGALLCEVGFTLLAAPLVPRLGPTNVAAWAAILATAQLGVLAAATEQPQLPTAGEAAALLYLATITTALAFVCWFSAVRSLGAGRAGLLVGLMPVAAVAVDAVMTGDPPSAAAIAGTALVGAGVALGSRRPAADFAATAMEQPARVG
jgi:drug/metabolite transporter (DMT)-like permease